MERRFVTIEKGLGPQGRIAVVRFDRGDNINALSGQAMRELRDVTRDFEDDLETSVVILTGSAKAFSAGFDLKDPEGRLRDTASVPPRRSTGAWSRRWSTTARRCPPRWNSPNASPGSRRSRCA